LNIQPIYASFIQSKKDHATKSAQTSSMLANEEEWDLEFDFEDVLLENDAENYGKEASKEICKFYLRGSCAKGKDCPFRHVRAEKAVVCKHWLRGLCKKGDACEFLHEYNPKKMPECWFFAKYQECSNQECIFLHIKPEDKIKPCPWYARGFCKHGPNCRLKHILRVACPDYMAGFCTKGSSCKFAHPKWEIPKDISDHLTQNTEFGVRRKALKKPTTQQQQRSIPTLLGDSDSGSQFLPRSGGMNQMHHQINNPWVGGVGG
jgi:cleavage and polyadenylation specificity factor subunit 4